MSTASRLIGLVFTLALLVGAAVADFYLIGRVLREHASSHWPSVSGTIATSTAAPYRNKSSRRYRLSVTYTFDAAGETRTGRVITLGESRGPSFRSEAQALRQYPVGATVPVYYDPASPGNAALVVGVQRRTVSLLLFAGVLNALALVMLRPSIRSFACRDEPIRYYLAADEPQRAVLRATHLNAIEFGVLFAGMASGVAGVCVLALPGAPLTAGGIAAGGVALVWLLGFLRRSSTLSAGRHDVVIERDMGTVTLPSRGGESPVAVDMAMVDRVELRATPAAKAKGGSGQDQSAAEVVVHVAGLDEPRTVASWITIDEAAVIASWLRQEFQLDPNDVVVSVATEDEPETPVE
ncbi:MAG TPA: DUF3592 domain-containing protein [Phycisphaerales bacterium]